MNLITRLLSALPRNLLVPVIVLAVGWYGGTKYGTPDFLMSSVDGLVAQGASIVGGLLNQDGEPAGDEDNGG